VPPASQVHRALDAEVALLGGDASRVAVGGQSQGGCVALDAALTYRTRLAGVFALHSQLYACTPIQPKRRSLRVQTFNGAADRCIAASLAMRSFATLIDAGYHRVRFHVEPRIAHCESSEAELRVLSGAILGWRIVEEARDTPSGGVMMTEEREEGGEEEDGGDAIERRSAEGDPLADAMGGLRLEPDTAAGVPEPPV
jgi:dienelactone hydrolase